MPIAIIVIIGLVALVGSLLAIVFWMAKDRMKARKQYEATLEKRLSSGADTMNRIRLAVEQLQTKFVEHLGEMMKRTDFDAYRTEHNKEHDNLENKVSEVKDRLSEVRERAGGLGERLDGSIAAMSGMLATLLNRKLKEVQDGINL